MNEPPVDGTTALHTLTLGERLEQVYEDRSEDDLRELEATLQTLKTWQRDPKALKRVTDEVSGVVDTLSRELAARRRKPNRVDKKVFPAIQQHIEALQTAFEQRDRMALAMLLDPMDDTDRREPWQVDGKDLWKLWRIERKWNNYHYIYGDGRSVWIYLGKERVAQFGEGGSEVLVEVSPPVKRSPKTWAAFVELVHSALDVAVPAHFEPS